MRFARAREAWDAGEVGFGFDVREAGSVENFGDGGSLIVADFEGDPTAGDESVEGVRHETADQVESVGPTEEGEGGIVHYFAGKAGALGFRHVREVGDDAIEGVREMGEQIAVDERGVGDAKSRRVVMGEGEGVPRGIGEGDLPVGSFGGEGEAEHAGAAAHVEDVLGGRKFPGQDPLGEFFGLGARDEGAGVGFEFAAVEADAAEQVLERNAFAAFFQHLAQGREGVFRHGAVELHVEVHASATQGVGHEHLHVAPRVLDTPFFQVLGPLLNRFEHGGHQRRGRVMGRSSRAKDDSWEIPIVCEGAYWFVATLPMKMPLCVIRLLWLLLVPLPAAVGAAPACPNIVVILADDLGYSDLGCYGGEIETPHLDALAAGGVRFTRFYNAARCCPTRAALLTGLYPHQVGVGHMVQDEGSPSYQGYLNDRCLTLAEALKPAGYTSMISGKWHVGSAPEHWPLQRGFDRFWGTPLGGGVYFKDTLLIRKEAVFVNDSQPVEPPDDMYVTDTITDRALAFIEGHVGEGKGPIFLNLAHIAPHWPLQAKPEDIKKYVGRYDIGWDAVRERRFARQKEMGLVESGTKLSPRDPQAAAWDSLPEERRKELARRMEIYAAQVDCLDQNVGRVVAKLKELGQFENTLIVFLSDNGCSAENGPGGFDRGLEGAPIGTGKSYASAGLEWANACNTPFRKFKMNTHEGGIATPFIAHWPASRGVNPDFHGNRIGDFTRKAKGGPLCHTPAHIIDLMPTLLEVAGNAYPAKRGEQDTVPLEGASLRDVFLGEGLPPRRFFWEHQGNAAAMDGSWKAVRQGANGSWELYDLEADPTELQNLAEQEKGRVSALAAAWEEWARRVGAKPFAQAPAKKRRAKASDRK